MKVHAYRNLVGQQQTANLQTYQKELLQELKDIRAAFQKDLGKGGVASADNN